MQRLIRARARRGCCRHSQMTACGDIIPCFIRSRVCGGLDAHLDSAAIPFSRFHPAARRFADPRTINALPAVRHMSIWMWNSGYRGVYIETLVLDTSRGLIKEKRWDLSWSWTHGCVICNRIQGGRWGLEFITWSLHEEVFIYRVCLSIDERIRILFHSA